MSFLLCHECYNWVEPLLARCPGCHNVVDASIPDPPLKLLQQTIGDLVRRIGEVKVRRPKLPDRGMLYATTNGLYYLPHQVETFERPMPHHVPALSPLIWSVAAAVWSPLMIVAPFMRLQRCEVRRVEIRCPQFLSLEDTPRLASLLMENPGVFFVPRNSVRQIERRWTHWRIERTHGSPLRLQPASNGRHFHRRMSELAASETWRPGAVCPA